MRRRPAEGGRATSGSGRGGNGRPNGALRTGRDGSYWQRKKRPQLLIMAKIVADLLQCHPRWGDAQRPLHVLDIGGGKGLLAQHLAERFGPECVNVTVVDVNERAIAIGETRVARRSASSAALTNLRFVVGDASELSQRGVLGDVDVVIGLHACGGLSDLIIAHAVSRSLCWKKSPTLSVAQSCSSARNFGEVSAAAPAASKSEIMPVAPGHEEETRTAVSSRCPWLLLLLHSSSFLLLHLCKLGHRKHTCSSAASPPRRALGAS